MFQHNFFAKIIHHTINIRKFIHREHIIMINNEYIQTSPRFMTDFTPWTLFVDTGIISVLLLLGKLMRVK